MLDVPLKVGSGRRVVLVHGFTQSGSIWQEVGECLASRGYEVVAPSLPGHGNTDVAHDQADLVETAELLVEICGRATYVGYSLGARVLLHAAANHPRAIEGLVLVGPRTTLDSPEREQRLQQDAATASEIENNGIDTFVDRWTALEFNQRIPISRRGDSLRRLSRPAGLAGSIRRAGLGSQSLVSSNVQVPSLLLAGEHDMDGVKDSVTRIARGTAGSTLEIIPGVGHGLPFELEPERFATIVDGYCRRS